MFLTNKLCTHAKPNCLNRTDYLHKNGFALNNLRSLICHKTKPSSTKYQRHQNKTICK